jgi:hypothetical protein
MQLGVLLLVPSHVQVLPTQAHVLVMTLDPSQV